MGQMESCGKLGCGMERSGDGGAMISYRVFRVTEGREREMSSQGEVSARPAGKEIGTSPPWKWRWVVVVPPRRVIVRSRRRREAARPAPEESPARII